MQHTHTDTGGFIQLWRSAAVNPYIAARSKVIHLHCPSHQILKNDSETVGPALNVLAAKETGDMNTHSNSLFSPPLTPISPLEETTQSLGNTALFGGRKWGLKSPRLETDSSEKNGVTECKTEKRKRRGRAVTSCLSENRGIPITS